MVKVIRVVGFVGLFTIVWLDGVIRVVGFVDLVRVVWFVSVVGFVGRSGWSTWLRWSE